MKYVMKKILQILQVMHYYKLALNREYSRLSVHDLQLLMTNGEDGKWRDLARSFSKKFSIQKKIKDFLHKWA
jgi:hypothetical protein